MDRCDDDDEEEGLCEGSERVDGRGGEHRYADCRRAGSLRNRNSRRVQRVTHALMPARAVDGHERVRDVHAVVGAEGDARDDRHHGDEVERDVPVSHEAGETEADGGDAERDEDAAGGVRDEEDGDEESHDDRRREHAQHVGQDAAVVVEEDEPLMEHGDVQRGEVARDPAGRAHHGELARRRLHVLRDDEQPRGGDAASGGVACRWRDDVAAVDGVVRLLQELLEAALEGAAVAPRPGGVGGEAARPRDAQRPSVEVLARLEVSQQLLDPFPVRRRPVGERRFHDDHHRRTIVREVALLLLEERVRVRVVGRQLRHSQALLEARAAPHGDADVGEVHGAHEPLAGGRGERGAPRVAEEDGDVHGAAGAVVDGRSSHLRVAARTQ